MLPNLSHLMTLPEKKIYMNVQTDTNAYAILLIFLLFHVPLLESGENSQKKSIGNNQKKSNKKDHSESVRCQRLRVVLFF